jgi:hypothetical protein
VGEVVPCHPFSCARRIRHSCSSKNSTTAGVAGGTERACPWLAQCGEWMAADPLGEAQRTLASRLAGFGGTIRQSTYLGVEPGRLQLGVGRHGDWAADNSSFILCGNRHGTR